MYKIMRIGTIQINEQSAEQANVYFKAEFKGGKFSMSGVVGPLSSGNCLGGCGQINMEFKHRNNEDDDKRYNKLITPQDITFAPGWDKEKLFDVLDIWEKWHLNDMQAACEHQQSNWNTKKEITLINWSWSDKFHQMRTKATSGELSPDEYKLFQIVSAEVLPVTIKSRIKWLSPLAEKLLADGWIKEDKRETKTAGWVDYREHPEGVLSKPCEVCGYKYGTSWLKKDVPAEVIAYIESLPGTDLKPAWI